MASSQVKACVICGKPAVVWNSEHVVPQWLLGWTEHPAVLEIGQRKLEHTLWTCTMRACESCNKRFGGTLESRVKLVFEKLRGLQPLRQSDMIDLLDWFDFVRTKLWLHGLERRQAGIELPPHMSAGERIRTNDRTLYIGVAAVFQRALTIEPLDDLVFFAIPRFMSLTANGLSFVSFSSPGIAGARLGLPFIREERIRSGGQIEVSLRVDREELDQKQILANPHGFARMLQVIYPPDVFPGGSLAASGIYPDPSKPETSVHVLDERSRLMAYKAETSVAIPQSHIMDIQLHGPTQAILREGRRTIGLRLPDSDDTEMQRWIEQIRALASTGDLRMAPLDGKAPAFRTDQGVLDGVLPNVTTFEKAAYLKRPLWEALWKDGRLELQIRPEKGTPPVDSS